MPPARATAPAPFGLAVAAGLLAGVLWVQGLASLPEALRPVPPPEKAKPDKRPRRSPHIRLSRHVMALQQPHRPGEVQNPATRLTIRRIDHRPQRRWIQECCREPAAGDR